MPKRIIRDEDLPKHRPHISAEGREQQVVALAYKEAERQIKAGTASSQVITHFLKLGTEKEKLEREKLENEIELLKEKKKALESAERQEELFAEAIKAFKTYAGESEDEPPLD